MLYDCSGAKKAECDRKESQQKQHNQGDFYLIGEKTDFHLLPISFQIFSIFIEEMEWFAA